MSASVRFLGVRGIRSTSPSIVAMVDGSNKVTWRVSGWACTCDDYLCGHVDAVADLIHPRVTGQEDPDRQPEVTFDRRSGDGGPQVHPQAFQGRTEAYSDAVGGAL